MKTLFLLACLLPCAARAATLSDCDQNTYEIIIRNGEAQRTETISPTSGEIREYGPVVSFQIKGGREMKATNPEEEFCIWNGNINVQRLSTHGAFPGM